MQTLGILIKSYRGHLNYTNQLVDTIHKHNKDSLPVYLSVPKADEDIFKHLNVNLLFDEDIVGYNLTQNWFTQQLVKMHFSDLGLVKNYLWIDADSYFIRDFYISDFMFDSETPYTNISECRDLLTFCAPKAHYGHVFDAFKSDRRKVMEVFGRKGKYFDWVCPNLWSSRVFEHMKEHYLKPNNLTYANLLEYVPGELIWYGEYLLASQAIRLVPCEAWFKAFHYNEQMNECRALGNTEETLAKNYLGIVMPSKETHQLRF